MSFSQSRSKTPLNDECRIFSSTSQKRSPHSSQTSSTASTSFQQLFILAACFTCILWLNALQRQNAKIDLEIEQVGNNVIREIVSFPPLH